MTVFEEIANHDHEQIVFCHDPHSGLEAIIGIHDTTLGPALGGCRMYPYKSEADALRDVLRLSRGMTYKAAAAGLNLGGGKAVILGDPKALKSEHLFRAYGRFVQGLGGRYITAEDVGTTVRDMEWVRMQTDFVTGISRALGGSGDPSPMTALGVFEGMKSCVTWLGGSEELRGKRVAIQGVGHVGYHLARLLKNAGAELVVCDVDRENLQRVTTEFSAVEVVEPDAIYDVECDIYAPCALGGVINDDTVPRLRCHIVAGSANNMLREERHAEALRERDILYAPDFVINAGGLINVANELEGYNQDRATSQVAGIRTIITQIFEIARQENTTAHLAAIRLAERRITNIGQIKTTFVGHATGSRTSRRSLIPTG